MKALAKRLDALEGGEVDLSPELKQWLGEPLTDAEHLALAGGVGESSEDVEP